MFNIVRNRRLLKLIPMNTGFGGMVVAQVLKEFRAT